MPTTHSPAHAGGLAQRLAQNLTQKVVLRIAVSQVLAETLREGHAGGPALASAPVAHRLEILVHAVVLEQPFALAGVGGQHRGLLLDHAR